MFFYTYLFSVLKNKWSFNYKRIIKVIPRDSYLYLQYTLTDNKSSPIIDVTASRLREIPKDYDITKFVKQKDDSLLSTSGENDLCT